MNNIESRLKRLEETVGVKTLTESSKQILNIAESAEQELFDRVLIPLFNSWGIDLESREYSEYYDGEYYLDSEEQSQVKTPSGYDQEMSFFIDVQKFAKLVTKHFVKEGLIRREFLTKPLPQFNINPVKTIRTKTISSSLKRLPVLRKFIELGYYLTQDKPYMGDVAYISKYFGKMLPGREGYKNDNYPKYELLVIIKNLDGVILISSEIRKAVNMFSYRTIQEFETVKVKNSSNEINSELESVLKKLNQVENKYS